jgi:hypothetical protein
MNLQILQAMGLIVIEPDGKSYKMNNSYLNEWGSGLDSVVLDMLRNEQIITTKSNDIEPENEDSND